MPPQQIATIYSSPALIRKNQIFRSSIFRPLPCRVENSPQDSERIEGEGFLLAAHFNRDKIAELKNEAANLMPQRTVLSVNRTAHQQGLLLTAEKAPQLF